jgi:hypothetical protein
MFNGVGKLFYSSNHLCLLFCIDAFVSFRLSSILSVSLCFYLCLSISACSPLSLSFCLSLSLCHFPLSVSLSVFFLCLIVSVSLPLCLFLFVLLSLPYIVSPHRLPCLSPSHPLVSLFMSLSWLSCPLSLF